MCCCEDWRKFCVREKVFRYGGGWRCDETTVRALVPSTRPTHSSIGSFRSSSSLSGSIYQTQLRVHDEGCLINRVIAGGKLDSYAGQSTAKFQTIPSFLVHMAVISTIQEALLYNPRCQLRITARDSAHWQIRTKCRPHAHWTSTDFPCVTRLY